MKLKNIALTGMLLMAASPAIAGELEDLIAEQDPLVQAIIQRESSGNPKAKRYEPHINDTSYGLMQILTETARGLERKHADLPRLGHNVATSLQDPKTNIQYGIRLLRDATLRYHDPKLAVAAYNSGFYRPRMAADQANLNTFAEMVGLHFVLETDGSHGRNTKLATISFQQYWNNTHDPDIATDGKIGRETREKIHALLRENNQPIHTGIMPTIPHTQRYVEDVFSFSDQIKQNHQVMGEKTDKLKANVYIIQQGDTLWDLGKRFGVSPQQLIDYNKITNPRMIQPGQQITIPLREQTSTMNAS